jgi:hypothetical protein
MPKTSKRHSGIFLGADFHIWGPGIRPNPSESDSLPNPSESGTRLGDNFNSEYRIAQNRSKSSQIDPNRPTSSKIVQNTGHYGFVSGVDTSRNPPESVRIRPSTESVRIPNWHPRNFPSLDPSRAAPAPITSANHKNAEVCCRGQQSTHSRCDTAHTGAKAWCLLRNMYTRKRLCVSLALCSPCVSVTHLGSLPPSH